MVLLPEGCLQMTHNRIPPTTLPVWLLETVGVTQEAARSIRDIESDLSYVLGLKDLDQRLRPEVRQIRDALAVARIGLSIMDFSTKQVLDELSISGVGQAGQHGRQMEHDA